MKIIVIGDIHGRTTWKNVIKQPYDKVIFVGDYFDSKEISQNKCLSNYLDIIEFKKSDPDKVILLFGNHDLHYLDIDETYSGYQPGISIIINEILTKHIKEKLHLMCYQYDNYLFSHAGVTNTWFNKLYLIDGESISDTINAYFHNFELNVFKFTIGKNYDKYGDDICQPPTWVRLPSLYNDRIKDFTHIVGHTHDDDIRIYDGIICVDCFNKYLIIDNNEIKKGYQ
jgi:predicted phosphodiesterase